jgi:hypothetical protein
MEINDFAREIQNYTQTYRHLWADCLDNVGSLTSHNPTGLQGLLQDSLALLYFTFKKISITWAF